MLSYPARQGQLSAPLLLSGVRASFPSLTPCVAPKPSPREEVILSSLGLCSTMWLSHSWGESLGGGSEGHRVCVGGVGTDILSAHSCLWWNELAGGRCTSLAWLAWRAVPCS